MGNLITLIQPLKKFSRCTDERQLKIPSEITDIYGPCPCLTSAWYSNFSPDASSPAGFSATAASHLTLSDLPLLLWASHLSPLAHLTAPLPRGATEVAVDGALQPAQGRSAATDDAPRVPLSAGAMGWETVTALATSLRANVRREGGGEGAEEDKGCGLGFL